MERSALAEPIEIRAAVCHEFGAELKIETVLLDPPKDNEVLVDIAACAICASDIHAGDGSWGGTVPVVHGHEAAGVVRTTGRGVRSVSAGDRVVVSLLRSCRSCFYCDIGSPHLCTGRAAFDIAQSSRLHQLDGSVIAQGISTAAFAESVVVHHSQLAAIPDAVPFESAALLACGVATGYGASTKTEPTDPDSTVVVIGAGGVGLNTIQGAHARHARHIVAIDLSDEKLASAPLFGATHTVCSSSSDPAAVVGELTNGRGADKVYITVGSTKAIEQGIDLCRVGGSVVIVGMTAEGQHINIETSEFASSSRRIVGSLMGSTDLQADIPKLIDAYLAGDLLLDELVTGRYPLNEINAAIASTAAGLARRNVVVFDL